MTSAERGERIATLEEKVVNVEQAISSQAEHLHALDKVVTSLVSEVKQIKNALYLIAVSMASQIPQFQDLLGKLGLIFGH